MKKSTLLFSAIVAILFAALMYSGNYLLNIIL